MVSAVFHMPRPAAPSAGAAPVAAAGSAVELSPGGVSAGLPAGGAAAAAALISGAASSSASGAVAASVPASASGVAPEAVGGASRWQPDWAALLLRVAPVVMGLGLFIGIWALLTMKEGSAFPTPAATWAETVKLFSDPFYRNGPNDQGIGWNILYSLQRVGMGFGLAALVGIPMGFAIGRFEFLSRMASPLINLLRPVSPLAWLPIGLLVFQRADPAAIWTIFICSIWPMVINTAAGVRNVPEDYLNVARVLRLSEWKVITRILLPAVLPHVLTGVRLSVSTAWLVIVAAEMLTGGVGIGFWVWDEWNNLNVTHILIAIGVIGLVGLLLEQALVALAKRFTYSD
jgi:nitrate/nitrite transport system permease protein